MSGLAADLFFYAPQDVLAGQYLFEDWDTQLVRAACWRAWLAAAVLCWLLLCLAGCCCAWLDAVMLCWPHSRLPSAGVGTGLCLHSACCDRRGASLPHHPTSLTHSTQVTELLSGMTPDAVRLDLCTRQYEEAKAALLATGWPGAADGQEPWFGFPYVQAQLPDDLRRG